MSNGKLRTTLMALSATALLGAAAPARTSPELEAVLSRFDAVQASIRSLSAEFTRTTDNPLFKEAQTAKGHLYLSKPSKVLWEFTTPEPMRFLISGNEYVGYFPQRKRAERKDIERYSEQIFRFLGVGQGSDELRKFYNISLGAPDPAVKGSYLLLLEPRKRRVKKRLDQVRLWMDAETHLPAQLAYRGGGGALETIVFRDVRLNPPLAAHLFRVDLPPDVVVTTGFSGFGTAPSPTGRP